jgi:8-oxo-dGTP pyrophosphatase MutT (NUDIX family)
VREAREEAGLDVRLESLVDIYSYPGRPLIIIVYAATIVGGTLCPMTSAWRRRCSHPDDIPWDQLAFQSTREALRDYLARKPRQVRPLRAGPKDRSSSTAEGGGSRNWYHSGLPRHYRRAASARYADREIHP